MPRILIPVCTALLLAACGGQSESGDAGADAHDHGPGGHSHGTEAPSTGDESHAQSTTLGSASLAGRSYEAAAFGPVVAGGEGHFELSASGGDAPAALRAWIGLEDGRGSMKSLLESSGDSYHLHLMAPDPLPEGAALWLEAEDAAGETSTASIPLPAAAPIEYTAPEGHSHDGHDHGPDGHSH